MPFLDKTLIVSRHDEHRWELEQSLRYQGRDHLIVVPDGFVTDYASVPRSLQWLAPSTGRYTLAAVVHDYLCEHMEDGYAFVPVAGPDDHYYLITSSDADGMFRRVMREENVRPVQRWLLWGGARIGAIRNPHRRHGTLRDLPALALLALLAAPFVLPVLAWIGLARLVYEVIEGLAGWFAEPFTFTEENR